LSERELQRHGVRERLKSGALSQVAAAGELGLSARQVRGLQRRLETVGPAGLRSARRGKKPNNWIDAGRREDGVTLIRERYPDFDLPHDQRIRLRTTNGLERINREIKRRARVASIFPNTASCLRLISALLAKRDEEWMTSKAYLNLKD